MKRKLLIIIGTVAILIVAALFFYARNKVFPVEKVELEFGQITKTVSAGGVIRSEKEANLAFPVTGIISKLKPNKGSEVKKGQVLGSIFSSPKLKTIQAAKDARDVALRDRDLFKDQNADNSQENDYKISLRRQNELVAKAEATYQAELATLQNYYIKAPFDGTIIDKFYEEGEVATAGSTIIKIANLENLYMEIELDQEDFGNVRLGQTSSIELDSYNNFEFTGKVIDLPQYAQIDSAGNESFIIKVAVKSTEDRPILLNMTGDVSIVVQEKENAQKVPFDILQSDAKGSYVWISKDGRAEKLYVETGLEGDLFTEVLTDLSKVTLIQNGSNKDLTEGLKVKVE